MSFHRRAPLASVIDLKSRLLTCSNAPAQFETILSFLEEFVDTTKRVGSSSQQLLAEILADAGRGFVALDDKLKHVVSGNEPR